MMFRCLWGLGVFVFRYLLCSCVLVFSYLAETIILTRVFHSFIKFSNFLDRRGNFLVVQFKKYRRFPTLSVGKSRLKRDSMTWLAFRTDQLRTRLHRLFTCCRFMVGPWQWRHGKIMGQGTKNGRKWQWFVWLWKMFLSLVMWLKWRVGKLLRTI